MSADGSRLEGDVHALSGALAGSGTRVALTGAGISVESGIPDFRSPGGLWSIFDPFEYATLSCFLREPDKAWRLYRALGRTIRDKSPNPAHLTLAKLERDGILSAVITQNVDGLHQAAGSRRVLEVHGDHRRLPCLSCGSTTLFEPRHLDPGPAPVCEHCGGALKPNVVLFEEPVREMGAILDVLRDCTLMLVAGTSAEVAPASLFPQRVIEGGGSLVEFNIEPTGLGRWGLGEHGGVVLGPVGRTLPLAVRAAWPDGTG